MNAQSKIEAATLASAMAAAFGEIESATKGAENPAFKQGGRAIRYADLTSVIDAIKPALINHGLFFTQHPEPNDKGVCIETVLHHASGEHFSLGKLFVPADKNNAQGFGSALTYARRYALVTAFGVPVEDDDGSAASAPRQAAARGSGGDNSGERQVGPTGPATVSSADLTMIISLCQAVGGGIKSTILDAYNVGSLGELNARQARSVIERLNEKLAEKVKDESNREAKNV